MSVVLKKVYIAGPMTGYKDFNYPEFNEVTTKLRTWGYYVENPAENDLPTNTAYEEYLKAGIKQLIDCSMVVLLQGWENSNGARLEYEIAKQLKLDIVSFEEVERLFNNLLNKAINHACN